jgi:hypothetical protein
VTLSHGGNNNIRMRIYQQTPQKIVRIQITRQGDESEYLNLIGCTQSEVIEFCKMVIASQNISIFEKGKRTSLNIREAIGSKNGKCKSISFTGLSPKETICLIVTAINSIPK